jgi:hypothetical protein
MILDQPNIYNHNSDKHREHIAAQKTTPFLVPVRDAKECLVSNYVMARFQRPAVGGYKFDIKEQIGVIKDLWEFVESEDRFFIAPFEEFTQNTENFFDTLEKTYPELKSKVKAFKTVEEVHKELEHKEYFKGRNSLTEKQLLELGKVQLKNMEFSKINSVERSDEDYWISTGHTPRPKTIIYDKVNEIVSSSEYESDLAYLTKLKDKLLGRYYK